MWERLILVHTWSVSKCYTVSICIIITRPRNIGTSLNKFCKINAFFTNRVIATGLAQYCRFNINTISLWRNKFHDQRCCSIGACIMNSVYLYKMTSKAASVFLRLSRMGEVLGIERHLSAFDSWNRYPRSISPVHYLPLSLGVYLMVPTRKHYAQSSDIVPLLICDTRSLYNLLMKSWFRKTK